MNHAPTHFIPAQYRFCTGEIDGTQLGGLAMALGLAGIYLKKSALTAREYLAWVEISPPAGRRNAGCWYFY
jgi:hypothetical protein